MTVSESTAARLVDAPFMTHHIALGFRGRCPCGWIGAWRAYDVSTVESDLADHDCEATRG